MAIFIIFSSQKTRGQVAGNLAWLHATHIARPSRHAWHHALHSVAHIYLRAAYLLRCSGTKKRALNNMWCDQAKSVWSRLNSVVIFLTNCLHHFHSYILQKTPLKLVIWFQRYEQLKDAKNKGKQKTFSALFGSILKSIFPTSDWFCLITSHMLKM